MEFLDRRDDYVRRFKVKVRNAGALPPFHVYSFSYAWIDGQCIV